VAVFGLLHGGFEGAWAWELLVPQLRLHGHEAIAVDLPIDDVTAGWDDHVDVALAAFGGKDAVVVAHSRSGRMVPRLLERGKFSDVIMLAAAIPGGILRPPYRTGGIPGKGTVATQARQTDSLGRTVCTRENAERLFSDCPPGTVDWALAKVRPQHELTVPDDTQWPDVRVAYVYGDKDPVVDPEWIRLACRERLGIEPVALTGGHSLFVSRPEELARTLDAIVRAR
jgi:pimeloyl-ACP methyl ester carboxylesterase